MSLQCNYNGPIPKMYVSRALSQQRQNWFVEHQLKELQKTTPDEEYIFYYDTEKFLNLLRLAANADYLRIYFGCLNGKLSLIYAHKASPEKYYVYNGVRFIEVKKGSIQEVGSPSHQTAEYLRVKAPVIKAASGVPDATRAIKFSDNLIKPFITEIEQQKPVRIKAQISSYRNIEPCPPVPLNYVKMIFVEFIFQTEEGATIQDAFIENCDNWSFRVTGKTDFQSDIYELRKKEFNNATLCPPPAECPELTLP